MSIQASDARIPQFCWVAKSAIPVIVAETGPYGLALFMVLAMHANSARDCWPSIATMAESSGMSPRKVRLTLRELEAAGIITTEHRRTAKDAPATSVYTLVDDVNHTARGAAPACSAVGGTARGAVGVRHDMPKGTALHAAKLEEVNKKKDQGLTPNPHDTGAPSATTTPSTAPTTARPTSPAGNPGDQVAERTVPTRGQQNASPSRAQRSTKAAGSSDPAGESEARGGRWAPVAAAIMAAIGRPAPRGKLPSWLGNAVATFGAAAGDDPAAAMVLVAGWTKSRPLREALERGIVRDHTVPAMVGSWIAAGNAGQPPAGVARKADPADRRMRELGAPENWRELVYAHDGTKRSPVLALPRIGLELYAPPASWPAWYRAFEGVGS